MVPLLTWPFLYPARIAPSSYLSALGVSKTWHNCGILSWQSILSAIWHCKLLKVHKPLEVIREVILHNPILQIEKQMHRGYPLICEMKGESLNLSGQTSDKNYTDLRNIIRTQGLWFWDLNSLRKITIAPKIHGFHKSPVLKPSVKCTKQSFYLTLMKREHVHSMISYLPRG